MGDIMQRFLIALLVLFFGLPAKTALSDPSPPNLFNFGKNAWCQAGAIVQPPMSGVIERERKVLDQALAWFARAIQAAKAKPAGAQQLATELARMAEAGVFTKLDWSGSGSSPAHWQSNLLKNIAISVNVVDVQNGWQAGQRVAVIAWGNTVYKSTHYSAWGRKQSDRWPDTIATAAAAYLVWGAVAPDAKAYDEGLKDFDRVAKLLKAKSGTGSYYKGKLAKSLPKGWGARIEDKTLGDLVFAAHVAKRQGTDLFTRPVGKGVSLYEAVVGWQSTLFDNNGAAVKGLDLSFLASQGGERSWAWTEYFVANFPDDAATQTLREKSARIGAGGYVSQALGPATCLMR